MVSLSGFYLKIVKQRFRFDKVKLGLVRQV